jgi:hypothetical protein
MTAISGFEPTVGGEKSYDPQLGGQNQLLDLMNLVIEQNSEGELVEMADSLMQIANYLPSLSSRGAIVFERSQTTKSEEVHDADIPVVTYVKEVTLGELTPIFRIAQAHVLELSAIVDRDESHNIEDTGALYYSSLRVVREVIESVKRAQREHEALTGNSLQLEIIDEVLSLKGVLMNLVKADELRVLLNNFNPNVYRTEDVRYVANLGLRYEALMGVIAFEDEADAAHLINVVMGDELIITTGSRTFRYAEFPDSMQNIICEHLGRYNNIYEYILPLLSMRADAYPRQPGLARIERIARNALRKNKSNIEWLAFDPLTVEYHTQKISDLENKPWRLNLGTFENVTFDPMQGIAVSMEILLSETYASTTSAAVSHRILDLSAPAKENLARFIEENAFSDDSFAVRIAKRALQTLCRQGDPAYAHLLVRTVTTTHENAASKLAQVINVIMSEFAHMGRIEIDDNEAEQLMKIATDRRARSYQSDTLQVLANAGRYKSVVKMIYDTDYNTAQAAQSALINSIASFGLPSDLSVDVRDAIFAAVSPSGNPANDIRHYQINDFIIEVQKKLSVIRMLFQSEPETGIRLLRPLAEAHSFEPLINPMNSISYELEPSKLKTFALINILQLPTVEAPVFGFGVFNDETTTVDLSRYSVYWQRKLHELASAFMKNPDVFLQRVTASKHYDLNRDQIEVLKLTKQRIREIFGEDHLHWPIEVRKLDHWIYGQFNPNVNIR